MEHYDNLTLWWSSLLDVTILYIYFYGRKRDNALQSHVVDCNFHFWKYWNAHCFSYFACRFIPIFSLPGFSDNDVYAKKTLRTFAKIPTESTLWEKISLCSDVMEGAWYMLFDDQKKSSRREKIKKVNPGKHWQLPQQTCFRQQDMHFTRCFWATGDW